MDLQMTLEELKKYADELIIIGDVNEYRINNNKDFLTKWTMLCLLLRKISKGGYSTTPIWIDALEIVDMVGEKNPSLRDHVDSLLTYVMAKRKSDMRLEDELNDNNTMKL